MPKTNIEQLVEAQLLQKQRELSIAMLDLENQSKSLKQIINSLAKVEKLPKAIKNYFTNALSLSIEKYLPMTRYYEAYRNDQTKENLKEFLDSQKAFKLELKDMQKNIVDIQKKLATIYLCSQIPEDSKSKYPSVEKFSTKFKELCKQKLFIDLDNCIKTSSELDTKCRTKAEELSRLREAMKEMYGPAKVNILETLIKQSIKEKKSVQKGFLGKTNSSQETIKKIDREIEQLIAPLSNVEDITKFKTTAEGFYLLQFKREEISGRISDDKKKCQDQLAAFYEKNEQTICDVLKKFSIDASDLKLNFKNITYTSNPTFGKSM